MAQLISMVDVYSDQIKVFIFVKINLNHCSYCYSGPEIRNSAYDSSRKSLIDGL